MEKQNIFEQIIVDKNEEKFFEIFKNETIKIEKIVSNGQISPENFWYEQEKSEFVLLLEGFAILEFENSGEVTKIQTHFCLSLSHHFVS